MDFNSYSTSAVNMDHYWIAHLTIQYNNHSQLTNLGSQLQNHSQQKTRLSQKWCLLPSNGLTDFHNIQLYLQ